MDMDKKEQLKEFKKYAKKFTDDLYDEMVRNFPLVKTSIEFGLNKQLRLGEEKVQGHKYNGTMTFAVYINGGCENGEEYI